jgi:hypothetical protein
MAKNKSSTALFDVIHAAKKPPKSSPSASIPAPRWWGKDKKPLKAAASDAADKMGENVGKQRSWLLAAKQGQAPTPQATPAASNPPIASAKDVACDSGEVSAPMEAAQVASVDIPVDSFVPDPIPAAPRVRFMDRFKKASSAPVEMVDPDPMDDSEDAPLPVFYSTSGDVKQPVVEQKRTDKPSRPGRERMVAVDRLSGDIRFNLSYGGAAAIGFIFCIALAIAFIAGTRTQTSGSDSDTIDSSAVASKPAPAAAVNSAYSMAVGPTLPVDQTPPTKPDVIEITPNTARHPAEVPATPPAAPLPIKATRDIGMIYMVIQSYPDQDLAQKACDFSNRAGVPCTLVQGLTGWAPHDWYSVVGLKPYKKHDPALEEDEKAIELLGARFSTKIYNQFQPQGYTWRGDSEVVGE